MTLASLPICLSAEGRAGEQEDPQTGHWLGLVRVHAEGASLAGRTVWFVPEAVL